MHRRSRSFVPQLQWQWKEWNFFLYVIKNWAKISRILHFSIFVSLSRHIRGHIGLVRCFSHSFTICCVISMALLFTCKYCRTFNSSDSFDPSYCWKDIFYLKIDVVVTILLVLLLLLLPLLLLLLLYDRRLGWVLILSVLSWVFQFNFHLWISIPRKLFTISTRYMLAATSNT